MRISDWSSDVCSSDLALSAEGARVDVVAPKSGRIRGWQVDDWGDEVAVDVALGEADPQDSDALVLPGGVLNPDRLRTETAAVGFVRSFFEQPKPVAAIYPGTWTLVAPNLLDRPLVTSSPPFHFSRPYHQE